MIATNDHIIPSCEKKDLIKVIMKRFKIIGSGSLCCVSNYNIEVHEVQHCLQVTIIRACNDCM